MYDKALIIIAGIFALVAVAVIIRYKTRGEAEFSLKNWFKFRFTGRNQPDDQITSKFKGVHLGSGAEIHAHKVIGGDNINIYSQESANNIHQELPQFKIALINLGRTHTYNQELEIHQNEKTTYRDYNIGFVLENDGTTTAKGIGIKLMFSWRGDIPKYSLKFYPPRRFSVWSTSVQSLVNEQPAILNFSDPDLICFLGQPIEWPNFRIRLQERLNGYILVEYKISSLQPQSDNNGELRIYLK